MPPDMYVLSLKSVCNGDSTILLAISYVMKGIQNKVSSIK